jgi:glyoxylase-like metal-dependent hydrolase (beta-lactamase superfamily II)/8-oxo-dGTP pyrophosphatase MutT (NUDIX family)
MTKQAVLRPAATLILVRDGNQGMEVFMMQRTHQAAFAPGGYVFPGGALDASDSAECFSVHCPGLDDRSASQTLNMEKGGLAYWVAAIRECFEESGLLLAYGKDGKMVELTEPRSAEFADFRQRVAAGELGFDELCRSHELTLALDRIAYFGHWITPMGAPRRFDTRFFIAVAPQGQLASHDNRETIAHAWMRPADVLERRRAGQIDIMFATAKTVESLAGFADTDALMKHVRTMEAVPSHTPRVSTSRSGRRVLVQGDYAYAEVGKLDPQGKGNISCELLPGVATQLSDKVWRLAAPNPGFMTGPGTNTYLIETDEGFAVIDPGPAIDEHVNALLAHTGGRIRWILTTHTHMDHSPAARLLKERTGAQVFGMPAPDAVRQDRDFQPDHVLKHGEAVQLGGHALRAIHTPGHASNHLCYLLEDERLLFTGDHIMQGSTVVINPPDGDMMAYLESLAQLKQLDVAYLAPGHGFLMDNPHQTVDRLLAHRLRREHKVVKALDKLGSATIDELVPVVYDDVPVQRHAMASRSLLAHLRKLQAEKRATENGERWEMTRAEEGTVAGEA